MSKRILVADSSQMDNFLTCPMMHQLKDKERLAPAPRFSPDGTLKGEVSDAIVMGTLGHRLMEIYYKSISSGKSWQESLPIALEFDPYTICICGHPHTSHSVQFPCIGFHGDKCNCKEYKNESFQLDHSTVESIKQRFREYTYTYRDQDIIPYAPETVEIGFSIPIIDTPERYYVVEGRIDVLGTVNGSKCVMDHKFQLRAKALYAKSIQFKTYAMVCKAYLLMVNYVRLSKGVTKDTIVRVPVSFTALDHLMWKKELIHIFDEMWEAQDSEFYKKRWSSCGGKYGYPCDFTPLCEEYNNDLINSKKMTMFQQRKEWKPW